MEIVSAIHIDRVDIVEILVIGLWLFIEDSVIQLDGMCVVHGLV